jgi:hypothetical protein
VVLVSALDAGAGWTLNEAHSAGSDLSPWAAGLVLAFVALVVGFIGATSVPQGLVLDRTVKKVDVLPALQRSKEFEGQDDLADFLEELIRESDKNAADDRKKARNWRIAHYGFGLVVTALAGAAGGAGLQSGSKDAVFGVLGLIGSGLAGFSTLITSP